MRREKGVRQFSEPSGALHNVHAMIRVANAQLKSRQSRSGRHGTTGFTYGLQAFNNSAEPRCGSGRLSRFRVRRGWAVSLNQRVLIGPANYSRPKACELHSFPIIPTSRQRVGRQKRVMSYLKHSRSMILPGYDALAHLAAVYSRVSWFCSCTNMRRYTGRRLGP